MIPEAAVEAAARAAFERWHPGRSWEASPELQEIFKREAILHLEAAAPHIAAQVPSGQEDRQNEIQAEVLIHARAVIVPALCTAEEWRHARVCSDFQEMIDAAQAGKLRKP